MLLQFASKDEQQKNSKKEIFQRHRGPVTSVCQIPNSSKVITSAYDGAVAIFDTDTHEVELLGYHQHLVNRVSVDRNGLLAASCSSDFNIHLWDLKSKQLIRVLRGHNDDVEDFIFIDQHRGASVSRDLRVLIWNLQTGAIEQTLLGHEQDVLSVSYLDGKLYTSGDDMTYRIWDLASGQLIKTLGPFDTETDTCAIDPIYRRALLGCDDGLIRIFDIDSGELIDTINAHKAGIKKIACSPLNGNILSAAYDQNIIIWDAASLTKKMHLEHRANTWERSFNWSNDGRWIYAGTFDGTLLKWNAQNGNYMAQYGADNNDEDTTTIAGNACFNDVALLKESTIAAVSDDGFVRTGRLSAKEAVWQHIHTPESGRILMNAITTQSIKSPQNNQSSIEIITGTHEQSLQSYSYGAGGLKQTLQVDLEQGPINCVRVSEQADFDGQFLVACYTGIILRVDRSGQVLTEIGLHQNAVKALALHPNKPIGVSCSADGGLISWDFDGKLLQHYPGHLAIIDDVDISPDGILIASAGRDFTLKIHNLQDGRLIHNINLGRRSPKAVTFVSNNIVIVTNYWGELLRVDLTTQSVFRRTVAQNGISGIAYRNDQLVVSSYDGGIYLVDKQNLKVINCLRSMTQRINSPAFGG